MEMRRKLLASGRQPVPASLQGVTKKRIAEVLRGLDLVSDDRVDALFALLDDQQPSWFSVLAKSNKFADGASIAHIACHVGILQRGASKLDRAGGGYWIKPLRDIGAVDPVYLDKSTRAFLPGHPKAKSPNSAYRVADEFRGILSAPADKWKGLLAEWIKAEEVRQRLEFQAAQAEA